MAIRWKQEDIDLLNRRIRSYNAKIRRLQSAGSAEVRAALPAKLTLKQAKKMIETRGDLKKLHSQIDRFTAPGSEKLVTLRKSGVTLPEFEKKELEARARRINTQRRRAAKKVAEARAAGDLPLMGRIQDQVKTTLKKSPSKVEAKDFERYRQSIMKQGDIGYPKNSRRQYVENYKSMIEKTYPGEAKKIKALINATPEKEFIDKTINNETISFDFRYNDPLDEDSKKSIIYDSFHEQFPDWFDDKGNLVTATQFKMSRGLIKKTGSRTATKILKAVITNL